PGEHVEGESPQHGLAPEGLLEPGAADVARGGHVSRKSLVRKKSETSTVIEEATTVAVVARPTPSAPPVVPSPLRHAMMPMKYAKKNDLPMPEATSSRSSTWTSEYRQKAAPTRSAAPLMKRPPSAPTGPPITVTTGRRSVPADRRRGAIPAAARAAGEACRG